VQSLFYSLPCTSYSTYFFSYRDKTCLCVAQHANSYDVGDELKTALDSAVDKCLPYACVVGLTRPIGAPLKSYYTDSLGVIQHQLFVEHKSKRTQGFW